MALLNKTKKTDASINASELEKKAASLGMDALKRVPKNIEASVINMIPQEVALKNHMVAFAKDGSSVQVAMDDPQNINALNVLRFIAEKEAVEITIFLASGEMVDEMLNFYARPTEMVKEAVQSYKKDIVFNDEVDNKNEERKREEVLKDAPVTKLVQVIISHAIEGKASDIHIEPMDKDYRVRFRVDGILHVSLILPKEIGPVVVSRVKILANLKIDEKRKPQDGRFRLTNNDKDIDFRVSTLPVISGEKITMRILDKDVGIADVESLGLLGSALKNIRAAIDETYGMILVTGPTGSGKSTTLYALLKILNNEERNIITLEDPIEYNIEGLNQSQIKPEIGYTFANGLRTILRQDPNIIMVGEIRDAETAELAVHAALTGHLMFSTLHTNTATGAIPRLIDMGIEPFLLSSSLRLVVAQRLVRMICEECKEEKKVAESIKKQIAEEIKDISEEELKEYNLKPNQEIKFYHGKGCDSCNGTGLKGRVAIYEVVPVTDPIREIMVEKRGNENLILAERDKMRVLTIKQDGILKILAGITTVEEIERVVEGKIALAEEDF